MIQKFYRIQPAGLGLNATGWTSNGEQVEGTFVFYAPIEVFKTDGHAAQYGNEVIEIVDVEEECDPGDTEGTCVIGGRISRRWTLDDFARLFGAEDFADATDRHRMEELELDRYDSAP